MASTKDTIGTWKSQNCRIFFEPDGGARVYQIEGMVTRIRKTGGETETRSTQTIGGNSISSQGSPGDFTVELSVIFRNNRLSMFDFGSAIGSETYGEQFNSVKTKGKKWRIIVWFASESWVSGDNADIPPSTGEQLRYIFKDCTAISFEEEFSPSDGLMGTLSFNVPWNDENGKPNVYKQYTGGVSTTALAVVGSTTYTTPGGTTYQIDRGGALTWTSTTTKEWTSSYT